MDVLDNNPPNAEINVVKNNASNPSTNTQLTRGDKFKNHTHVITTTSTTNQANNLKIYHQIYKGAIQQN